MTTIVVVSATGAFISIPVFVNSAWVFSVIAVVFVVGV